MPPSDTNTPFAALPDPPYYAVIFTAQRTSGDNGYAAMAAKMSEMAQAHPGCIGMETTRDETGFGITVSYWKTEADILDWKADAKHLIAQQMGKSAWYNHYILRISKVERQYDGPEGR
ncbi:antibiotic biosynthesis monooxygenase family protein [Litoreibacter roseus]|uniref:Polysaccharide biosynthesis protein n=1 Tax=Litoreibacter roseus TaxID=2601869 RepID=A0A6N6JMV4_9RHOB|nr:antibiotic biosynthesis monooxygenase [Litoreibacter roseus]GFE66799.1 polysaccharide biosynthesis protein [Litoreibacter roseus]